MSLILTICYLAVGAVLLWQSSSSPDRDFWRRARLYALGFSCMSFGAAQFMALVGEGINDWRWIVAQGHLSLLAFAVMWITRERGWLEQNRTDGGTKI